MFALAQRGKPYLWGGTGPARYDCSGLTQRAYAVAGIAIPRVAADQARIGAPVALADLLPGDLVFYAYDVHDLTTIHHVAMYIGDGLVVHAPQTGDVVRIAPLWLDGYVGAVRPTAAVSAGVPLTVGTFPVQPAPRDGSARNPITRPEPLGPPPDVVSPGQSPAAAIPPTTAPPATLLPTTLLPTTLLPTTAVPAGSPTASTGPSATGTPSPSTAPFPSPTPFPSATATATPTSKPTATLKPTPTPPSTAPKPVTTPAPVATTAPVATSAPPAPKPSATGTP